MFMMRAIQIMEPMTAMRAIVFMEPIGRMRTNFHRGNQKKVVSQRHYGTHCLYVSHKLDETQENDASYSVYANQIIYASHPPNETHRNCASHDYYGTHKMYANRWGCGNHSKNVNHILDVAH